MCGPRYWTFCISKAPAGSAASSPCPLGSLYTSRSLMVQRKTGTLSYRDDPTGVRSILSRAFTPQVRRKGLSWLFSDAPLSFPPSEDPCELQELAMQSMTEGLQSQEESFKLQEERSKMLQEFTAVCMCGLRHAGMMCRHQQKSKMRGPASIWSIYAPPFLPAPFSPALPR